ncbi:hypothetical protein [Haloferax sp. AS1]|uniref:hypothetical protein n=1 Tax=Haloferax sp. AS1 TaxID=2562277 RepID=UPI00165FABB0|nr:hypothetical protein [Haloferax sp. AS1]
MTKQYPQTRAILRLEPSGKFIDLLKDDPSIEHVMVTLSKAERVLENYGGFNNILQPHHKLTIVGTEPDATVTNRGRWQEIDLYAEFEREARIIPDWLWVYHRMEPDQQLENVEKYLSRFEWLYKRAEEMGLPHEITPLAKGVSIDHFEESKETFDRLGIDRFAMYGVQTPSHYDFCERIEQASAVLNPDGVLTIGRGSPRQVGMMPEIVDETAGWHWKRYCGLTSDGYSQYKLAMWIYKIKRALHAERTNEQSRISDFIQETEVAING